MEIHAHSIRGLAIGGGDGSACAGGIAFNGEAGAHGRRDIPRAIVTDSSKGIVPGPTGINVDFISAGYYLAMDTTSLATQSFTMHQVFTGGSANTGVNMLGLTNGLGLFTSIAGFCQSVSNYLKASKIHDFFGRVVNGLSLGRFSASSINNMIGLPTRIATIIGETGAASVNQVALQQLGRTSTILSFISTTFLGLVGLVKGAKGIRALHRLNAEINKGDSEREKALNGITYLVSQLELTDEERGELLTLVEANEDDLDEKTPLEEPTEEERKVLTKEDVNFLEGQESGLTAGQYTFLEKELINRKLVKINDFHRNFGADVREKLEKDIRKTDGPTLIDQLNEADVDESVITGAMETVNEAKSKAVKKITLSVITILTCALVITALVLGTISTGGGLLVGALILGLIATVLMSGLDGYDVYSQLKDTKLSEADRTFLLIMNVLLIVSTVVGGVLSGGGLPLAIVLVGGISALLTNLYMISKVEENKQEDGTTKKEVGLSPDLHVEIEKDLPDMPDC